MVFNKFYPKLSWNNCGYIVTDKILRMGFSGFLPFNRNRDTIHKKLSQYNWKHIVTYELDFW